MPELQRRPAPVFPDDPDRLPRPLPRPETPHHQDHHHHHPVGTLPAIQSLLYVLVVALFLITFTVQPIRIPSGSMEPTLLVGDFLLLNKQSTASSDADLPFLPPTSLNRGDIVVFHDPVDDPSVHLVKRIIALPGDRLHLRNGIVFLNGHPLREPYAVHRPAPSDVFRDNFPLLTAMDTNVNPDWWIRLRTLIHGGEITVPPASYFVMGDNRNNSEDSRYWGFVPRADIVGKPFIIYFSWKQPDPNTDPDADPDTRPADPTARSGLLTTLSHLARWDRTFQVVH
ncbi:signal peptidase I [Granulicella tundricola]|uniref:Signal peptidase I n=1 Tax=Granulicella tundricola (strain ATCC BAA-1859 / DSM 23138 / MP5ACTX9) TaxID=1198114 RepID=E8X1H4_GRATM|nr:signal peptidase I [Granulicella tundricola]ADW70209.1 signal peptidase I [Granulicella tundricola MP5ACTX9]